VSSYLLSRRLKFKCRGEAYWSSSGGTSGGRAAVVGSCQLCSALVYVMLLKPQAAVKTKLLALSPTLRIEGIVNLEQSFLLQERRPFAGGDFAICS
jgi:hypothetical protein